MSNIEHWNQYSARRINDTTFRQLGVHFRHIFSVLSSELPLCLGDASESLIGQYAVSRGKLAVSIIVAKSQSCPRETLRQLLTRMCVYVHGQPINLQGRAIFEGRSEVLADLQLANSPKRAREACARPRSVGRGRLLVGARANTMRLCGRGSGATIRRTRYNREKWPGGARQRVPDFADRLLHRRWRHFLVRTRALANPRVRMTEEDVRARRAKYMCMYVRTYICAGRILNLPVTSAHRSTCGTWLISPIASRRPDGFPYRSPERLLVRAATIRRYNTRIR